MEGKTRALEFVESLLPHYNCTEEKRGSIRCTSYIGMDEKEWSAFKNKIIEVFKKRFQEIFHNVNNKYTDFYIYYKTKI